MFDLYASTSESEGEDGGFNEDFLIQGTRILMAESCTAASHRIQRGLHSVGLPSAISLELIPKSYCVQPGPE